MTNGQTIRMLMLPTLDAFGGDESGIKRVIEAYHQYLPKYGVVCVGKDDEYDTVVSHAGSRQGASTVVCHGLYWTADYASDRWEYHVNAEVIQSLRSARQITVPSSWVAETFRRDMRINPTVIGHGIEAHLWRHDHASNGYVLWNKNRMADVCSPYPVGVLARAFPNTTFITTFAPDRNAPKASNVVVTGLLPHDQMKPMIQKAGVYLSTTKETFGIGVLEAMACGIPILGFAHGGNLDLVQHGLNGYLAEPGNYDDLRKGLDYCLRHQKQLGQNGLVLVKEWTWDKAVEKVAAVIRLAMANDEQPMRIDPSLYLQEHDNVDTAG